MRETPYESHDLSPKEICEKVAKQMSPPFRPDFKAPESPQVCFNLFITRFFL